MGSGELTRSDYVQRCSLSAIPIDISFSSGHPYDRAILRSDLETGLGTDKGKPVRKSGTQSYRSNGITA
jgi:hypothetical protein